jgi:hypothetical protein
MLLWLIKQLPKYRRRRITLAVVSFHQSARACYSRVGFTPDASPYKTNGMTYEL